MIKYRIKKDYRYKSPISIKTKKKKSLQSIPDIKPLPYKVGVFIFFGLTIPGILIGTIIATYIFFGIMTLAGLIAIIESNKYLKYLAIKSNKLIDILIFTGTVYSTISLGITITASLTIAGLGYTLLYAPWLRSQN